MPFKLDPEFTAAISAVAEADHNASLSTQTDDIKIRRQTFSTKFGSLLAKEFPRIPWISRSDFFTKSADGHEVLLRWYSKTSMTDATPGPAILFIHSGGLIYADVSTFDGLVDGYVNQSEVPYLSVEYRLAPEHKYPKALEDVYAGLTWLHAHTAELGVNPERIAIHGESAGGGLAAALAIYTGQKNGPRIAKQILIYPMLDDRVTKADPFIEGHLVWSGADNRFGWKAYLGDMYGGASVAPMAAPARLEDHTGLPPMYVEVGLFDLFRDQVIEYANRSLKAGVEAELHLLPGVPHGFEWFASRSRIGRTAMRLRKEAAQSI
jgi:acetyl esterase/lipase